MSQVLFISIFKQSSVHSAVVSMCILNKGIQARVKGTLAVIYDHFSIIRKYTESQFYLQCGRSSSLLPTMGSLPFNKLSYIIVFILYHYPIYKFQEIFRKHCKCLALRKAFFLAIYVRTCSVCKSAAQKPLDILIPIKQLLLIFGLHLPSCFHTCICKQIFKSNLKYT